MASPARSLRGVKIAVVLFVLVALVVAHRFGVFERFAEPARMRQTLVELGPWGYAAFVVAFSLVQPFGVPGTVFAVASSLVWPWPIAFALSLVGSMGASVLGFSFARFVARDWVSQVVPERFKKYDDALAQRALPTVIFLRFIFLMSPLLHTFLGVSKVRFSTHFWGSLLGYVVPLFCMTFFGAKVFEWLRHAPPEAWIAVAAVVLLLGIGLWWRRRRQAVQQP